MMNPSNAAHNKTDETVNQLINIAKTLGYHSLQVVNISSVIDGTSSNLNNSQFAYDVINWAFVSNTMLEAKAVFLGWGVKGQLGIIEHLNKNSNILRVFKNSFNKLHCYDVLKSQDLKFAKKPLYYVPHPRPMFEKEKYLNTPIRQLTEHEFIQLFHR